MWSWAACSDPAGAPALRAPCPAVRLLSSGLRIYEAMAVTSTRLEELSRSNSSPGSRACFFLGALNLAPKAVFSPNKSTRNTSSRASGRGDPRVSRATRNVVYTRRAGRAGAIAAGAVLAGSAKTGAHRSRGYANAPGRVPRYALRTLRRSLRGPYTRSLVGREPRSNKNAHLRISQPLRRARLGKP